jgi:hypothetical protein
MIWNKNYKNGTIKTPLLFLEKLLNLRYFVKLEFLKNKDLRTIKNEKKGRFF